jgi:hypothetical protein
MHTLPITKRLALLGLVGAAGLTLTGCSPISNALHKVHEESFSDRAAAEQGWVGVPAPGWLPEDAMDIRNLATTNESNAVIRVSTSSDLPTSCVEADRVGIPFDTTSWTPVMDRFPDRVQRCGAYEVVPVEGGWFGWFSATEEGGLPTATP